MRPSAIGAYAIDSENRVYFRGLRARRESEAKMLDADLRSEKITDLGETGGAERKRSTEAQKQWEFDAMVQRALGDIQIPALPTFDTEYYEDEVDDAGVQNPVAAPPRIIPTGVHTL
jgi:hypothetical protein